VPMATPLAVPVVDLPVVWWPWRPRHHHYYCIISFRVFMFLVPLIRRKSVLLFADIKKPIRTIATETWILDPQCTTESETLIEVCIIYHIYIYILHYITYLYNSSEHLQNVCQTPVTQIGSCPGLPMRSSGISIFGVGSHSKISTTKSCCLARRTFESLSDRNVQI